MLKKSNGKGLTGKGMDCAHLSVLNNRVLRSAVGKTHDLRSDLWWTIPLHISLDRFGIPLGFQPIKSALARHSGVQVPVVSRLPVPTYGSTWVVLWLLFCRSASSTFPVTWSTLKGPFRGVPSLRLYSEIDHISSEAQCVSHHLPQVVCHTEPPLDGQVLQKQ